VRLLAVSGGEVGMLGEVVEVRLLDERPALERVVVLGLCQGVAAAAGAQRAAAEVERVRGAQQIGVGARSVVLVVGGACDPAAEVAAVTEVDRHGVVGLPGHLPHRQLEFPLAAGDGDQILVLQPEGAGGGRADERGVVPGQLGDRIGELLEPAVVREAPVVERRRAAEDDLQLLAGCDRAGGVAGGLNGGGAVLRRNRGQLGGGQGAALLHPVVEHPAPGNLELGERDGKRQRHGIHGWGLGLLTVLSRLGLSGFLDRRRRFRLGAVIEGKPQQLGPGLADQVTAVPWLAQGGKREHLDGAPGSPEGFD